MSPPARPYCAARAANSGSTPPDCGASGTARARPLTHGWAAAVRTRPLLGPSPAGSPSASSSSAPPATPAAAAGSSAPAPLNAAWGTGQGRKAGPRRRGAAERTRHRPHGARGGAGPRAPRGCGAELSRDKGPAARAPARPRSTVAAGEFESAGSARGGRAGRGRGRGAARGAAGSGPSGRPGLLPRLGSPAAGAASGSGALLRTGSCVGSATERRGVLCLPARATAGLGSRPCRRLRVGGNVAPRCTRIFLREQ